VVADGAGIKGMRERALLIDADLTITSPTAGGTEVRLTVPLGEQSGR
jgi:two-component system sensor histidine kinase UhpB